MDELLTLSKASTEYKIPKMTLWRRVVKDGAIPFVDAAESYNKRRKIQIRRGDLEKYLARKSS